MSSGNGPRGNPNNYHYGASDGDHIKRKRSYFSGSTRRDFKSSGPEPLLLSQGRPALASDRRVSGELANRLRYRDLSRDRSIDYRDNPRDNRDNHPTWDSRDSRDISRDSKDYRDSRIQSRDLHRDSLSYNQSQGHNQGQGQGPGHRENLNHQANPNHLTHRENLSLRDNANHRDSQYPSNTSNTQISSRNPRSNSYSKDYRYGSYNKSYSSYNNSYSERSGAYGSFNGSKRSDSDYYFNRESRDRDRERERERDRERDRESGGFREAWRSEKPRQTSSSRFNPNNIPVNLRNNLNHGDSPSNEHKKEKFENYDDQTSNRYYSTRRVDNVRADNRPDSRESRSESRDIGLDNRDVRDIHFRSDNQIRSERSNSDYTSRVSQVNRDRQQSANNVTGPSVSRREAKSFSGYQNRHTDHYPNGYGSNELSEENKPEEGAFDDQSKNKSVSDFKQPALIEVVHSSDGHHDNLRPNRENLSTMQLKEIELAEQGRNYELREDELESLGDRKGSRGPENANVFEAVQSTDVDANENMDVDASEKQTAPTSERTEGTTEPESTAGDEESEYVPSEDIRTDRTEEIRTDRTDKTDISNEASEEYKNDSRKGSDETYQSDISDDESDGVDLTNASITLKPADTSYLNDGKDTVSDVTMSNTKNLLEVLKKEQLPLVKSETPVNDTAISKKNGDESATDAPAEDDEAETEDELTEAGRHSPNHKAFTKSPSIPATTAVPSNKMPTFAKKPSTTDIFGQAEPTIFGIIPKKELEAGLDNFVPTFRPEDEPIMYPNGCTLPQTKLEAQLCLLEEDYKQQKTLDEKRAQTSQIKPVEDFTHLQFYSFNLSAFVAKHETLFLIVRETQKATKRHQLQLWAEYERLRKENEKRIAFMDEQLRVLHPGDDEATRELLAIDTRQKNGTVTPLPLTVDVPQSGRRNRRHGDLVTTEAEFQEILKTLENEENESPIAKAKRVAATIPDLIVDPILRDSFKFMDSNNFVFDKQKWANRIDTDFVDTFTEKEHDLFCEAYCQYPKKFGQVSQAMGGLRLSQECVLHYYMTKKAVNYKLLLSQYKKKSKKAIRRRKKKSVVSASPSLDDMGKPRDDTDLIDGPESAKIDGDSPIVDSAETFGKRGAKFISETPEAEQPLAKRARTQNRSDLEGTATPTQGPVQESGFETDEMEDEEDELRDGLSNDEKRKNISSYWSITETNDFPHLLNQFGSQWSKIAEKLATKSATMVRNQYQRKGKEFGWFEVVRAADQRLARKPYVSGETRYSNFDTTLIVKPQRSTNVGVPNTEIHVYDAAEAAAVAAANAANSANSADAISSNRISVSNLMGSPMAPTTMSTFSQIMPGGNSFRSAGLGGTILPSPSARFFTQSAPHVNGAQNPVGLATNVGNAPVTKGVSVGSLLSAASPVKTEGVHNHPKPSIMNLLNVESPVKEVSLGNNVVTEARVPVAPPASNNIASLLNTPSSPAAPQHSTLQGRSSNINSLLG